MTDRETTPASAPPPAVEHAAVSPVVLDIAGTALDADDRRRIAHPLTGGLILFTRNWRDQRQLGELTAEIKSIRPDVLICVDQEGGRVQRLRGDGFTRLPPMRALGGLWQQDDHRGVPGRAAMAAVDAATATGHVLAAELRACGVDFSFAPVLDLDHGPSGVIGDRALHREPQVVTALAKGLLHGMMLAGMQGCGKHFPGHGFVAADSHVDVPHDGRDLESILAEDARPFEWLGSGLASVMPAHLIYPAVDTLPAGFSPRWLKDILRSRLGFRGAVFSDDLSMAGARQIGGVEVSHAEAATAALAAGCDLVLLCNQSLTGGKVLDRFLDDLADALVQGRWQVDPASEPRRLGLLPGSAALGWDALMQSADYRRSRTRLP